MDLAGANVPGDEVNTANPGLSTPRVQVPSAREAPAASALPATPSIGSRRESESYDDSPEKYLSTRKRGQTLRSRERQMVLTVYANLRAMHPDWSRKQCEEHVAKLTGVSDRSIRSLKKEHQPGVATVTPGKHRAVPDNRKREAVYGQWVWVAVRRKVHQLFREKIPPTSKRVMAAINQDPELPNLTLRTMRRILRDIGFRYMKRSRRSILLEREELVVWRRDYLMKMREFRAANRSIVYLDESYVNQRYTTTSTWHDTNIRCVRDAFREGLTTGLKTPTGKGGRFVLIHAGGDFGFVDGAKEVFQAKKSKNIQGGTHHDEMNAERFHSWFRNLIPKLPPNSVIVLDNASYHSVVANRVPTMSDRRDAIISWLMDNGLPYTEDMCKAELMNLVKSAAPSAKRYVVDEMAREAGHTVIRLPPYHCELNPIELIWAQVKNFVAMNNVSFTMRDVEALIEQAFATITTENWKRCVDHVIKIENEMIQVDFAIDDVFDNTNQIIVNLGEDSSDEEDEPDALPDNTDWANDNDEIFERALEEEIPDAEETLALPLSEPEEPKEPEGFLTDAYRVLFNL